MKVERIKSRSVLFTYDDSPEWDLNLHLIMGEKYNYIIDTGLGPLSIEPIKEYLKDDHKAIIVINTHYHWDHIWGNCAFQDSIIISHRLCREIMASQWDSMIEQNRGYLRGQVVRCLPNLVFENELYFPDDQIRLIYTPGHTVDSISVIDEKDRVINAGDNIGDTVEAIVPEIDCERNVYMNALLKYREMDFDTCISGHNIVLNKDVIEDILNRL